MIGELIPLQTSINHEMEGLRNSASKAERSEDMPVTFWKSVSRNLSWMLKPKSEMNYKKKATKCVTDKSGQIDNIVQDDVVKVEEIYNQLIIIMFLTSDWKIKRECSFLFPLFLCSRIIFRNSSPSLDCRL